MSLSCNANLKKSTATVVIYSLSGLIPRSPACHKHVVCAAGRLLRQMDARPTSSRSRFNINIETDIKSAGMTKKEMSFPNVLIGNPEKTD